MDKHKHHHQKILELNGQTKREDFSKAEKFFFDRFNRSFLRHNRLLLLKPKHINAITRKEVWEAFSY